MMLVATLSLTQREIVRFLRQRSRVVGGLAPPLLFWFLIGSGLGESFQPAGSNAPMTSLEYLFPGTLLLIMLFTAIFSTISVIEDRREGFLQSVLVAPHSRGAFVLGKLLGGTLLALVQVILVLLLAPFLGMGLTWVSFLQTTAVLFVVGFGFTGLGFLLAWRLDSSQGFHALMNLLLMPMWILSGALFPASGAPGWLRAVMLVNPMSHALDAVRLALYAGGGTAGAPVGPPAWGPSLGVSILFSVLMLASSWWLMNRPRAGDLS
jgi:ABC-2 type transport system permease protein